MPERLPWELRVLYDVARTVGDGPSANEESLARIAELVRSEFAFERVQLLRGGDEPELARARTERAAVARAGRVVVPLLDGHDCLGFLVGERGDEARPTTEELQLLSAVGLLAGVVVAKAVQQAELEQALDELRRVDELKDEFVSVASHELRAPIAVVHGIAATLHARADELDLDRTRALRGALLEQSSRLRDLAEQLLDLSRLDSGRLRVEHCAFRPRETVDALLPRIAPDRLDDVDVRIDPSSELVCDSAAFERVVGNLVTNALAYGRPPVLVQGAEGGDAFRLSVEDRGPGVDPEFVPQLFDRFTRSEGSRRVTSGAGLGLAIARRYAEAVGGDLHYEAAAPRGARFVLELPLEPATA